MFMKKYTILLLLIIIGPVVLKAQMINPRNDFGNNHQPIRSVLFTPDSRHLIAGGFMKIYDIESGNDISPVTSATDIATANLILHADMSNDGRYLAIIKTGRLEIYDRITRSTVKKVRAINMAAADIAPDNKTLVYAQANGNLVFYDIQNERNISEHDLNNLKPNRLAWSNSGKYIAIGGRGNVVLLFDAESKQVKRPLNIRGKFVWDIEFSDDSKYLAIASRSGDVTLVDTESGNPVQSWSAHGGEDVFALSFHPSGQYLATGGGDNRISIWEIPSCKSVNTWPAHENKVLSLDFSPDGTMLASGCLNGPMQGKSDTRVWNVSDAGISDRYAQASNNISPSQDDAVVQEEVEPVSENLQAAAAAEQKRLALVIGNGIYTYGGVLANPENDANDISSRLQGLGFDVMVFNNLGLSDFKKAIDDFGLRLAGYDIGLFYYAGHGIQVKGNNYLIPVDANLRTENDVEYDCVNAGRLLAKMEDAGSTTNIIILDACRDNPFERSWRRATHGMGLAFMTAPAGSLISYATSPGATASDGSGRNGLFTSALLNYIDEPGLSILEMFQKVRTYVRENSGGEQVPWESTSLEGNFYMRYE